MPKIENLINKLFQLFSKKVVILILIFFYIRLEIIARYINENYYAKDFVKNTKCDIGYKFINGICVINHSFEILYKTFTENEKVVLINKIYEKNIEELIIDNTSIIPSYYYSFQHKGEHLVKLLLNSDGMNNAEKMFYNISNIISFKFTELEINNLTNMREMFKNCNNLEKISFSQIKYGKVIDLSYMFENCRFLRLITNMSLVSKYTKNISYIFANCSSLEILDLSKFETSSVDDMSGIFFGCSSLKSIDLSSFKTSNLIYINSMFDNCPSITSINISFFELNKVKNMDYMFRNCSNLKFVSLPDLNSEYQINKSNIFIGCNSLNSSIESVLERNITKKYDICIVGIWWGNNYGSMINNYALHQAVSKMGYSILMIEKPTAILKKNYSRINPRYITRSFYNVSKKKNLSELYELNEECNIFLVGSDQIWNTALSRQFEQFYFLGFVDDKKKKISYATSFGRIYNGNEEEKKITKKNLKRFYAISVRDELSINITKNIFDIKNVVQVCDPSFLCNISEYNEMINKAELNYSNEYILAYILDPNEEIGHRLEKLSIDKNITIVILLDHLHVVWKNNKNKLRLRGMGKIDLKYIVDLNEWLWYFNNSKAVFTDSFHGTIFSIIFKKPFITLRNIKRGGTRFTSLLEPINLGHRLFETPNCINEKSFLFDKINYTDPLQKLSKIRNYSYLWLKNILKQVINYK